MKDSQKLLATGIFTTLVIMLLWTIYWTIKLYASLPDIYAVPDPLGKLYLSSTLSLTFLCAGITIRTIAVVLAIATAYNYYKKGWIPTTKKILSASIILEAIYVLSILPTAWVGPDVNDIVLIPEATIPSLFEAIIISIPLIMLAIRLRYPGRNGTAIKWACLSGVTYILSLGVRFTGQWVATFIQTPLYTTFFGGFPAHGFSYITDYPINMISFILTSVGLPLIAIYFLATILPTLRNSQTPINLQKIGLTITLVGAYFMIVFFMLYGLPAYVGQRSIWSAFFTGHNVDLWMVALPIIGIPLMLKKVEKETA